MAGGVLAVTVASALLTGLVLTLPVSLRPALLRQLRLDEDRYATLWAGFNLGLIPLLIVCGVLLDVLGVPLVLVLGSTLLILGTVLLVYQPRERGVQGTLFLWGAGAACLCVVSITLMPHAFFGTGEVAASLNLGLVFFALGALIAPTLTEVLLRGLGWQRGLGAIALLGTLPPTLAWALDSHLPELGTSSAGRWSLLGDPVLWLATAAFFLYAPLEGTVSAWFTRWLRDLGHEERRARALLAAFWSAFLISRLLMAYLLHLRLLPQFAVELAGWTLAGLALLASVLLGNLSNTLDRGRGVVGVLLLGLLMGPIFPTLIGLVLDRFPSEPGLALGVVVGLGSLGSLVLVPVIGLRMRVDNAHTLMRLAMVIGLVMAGFVVWFVFALQS